jgi:hypothetical protein
MKGWKTILFNIGLAVVGVLQASDLATIISDPQVVGIAVTAIGAIGVVLRFLTNTAVASKG